MPEIALEPRPGDSLGPNRITRVIGPGRMGIVFEGTSDGDRLAVRGRLELPYADRPHSASDCVAGVGRASSLRA